MANIKLETHGGDTIEAVAKKAKQMAKDNEATVEFDFNGIKCLVSEKTVVEWLVRDYMNAFIMEWKVVGDDCPMMYDADTEIELRSRQLEQAKKEKEQQIEQNKKDKEQQDIVDGQTKNVELEIFPDKITEYKEYVEKNSNDGYSRACVDYAEQWAKLMQIEIAKGAMVKDIADKTQEPLGYLGITGFMYGCAVSALSHFWVHGEELRKWHNKEWGVDEDKKGVVNPALWTISGK